MWIDNPDSPNLMPDSFANARPELRAYMTGRSPNDIREDSYRNTRDELRSKIDSQETFSRIAGKSLRDQEDDLLKKSLIEPVIKPYVFEEPTRSSVLDMCRAKPEPVIPQYTPSYLIPIEPEPSTWRDFMQEVDLIKKPKRKKNYDDWGDFMEQLG